MTKLELTIRQVSDLRDFYLKLKKYQKIKNHMKGTKGSNQPAKPMEMSTLAE